MDFSIGCRCVPMQNRLCIFGTFPYNARFISKHKQTRLNMYAVIKTGGKQYRVAAGDKLKVEQLVGEVGSELIIDKVLMVADGDNVTIGSPLVNGASVK